MPLNSASNSSSHLNIRRCSCRSAGAACVKLTLNGRQCAPSSAAHRRNSTPIASSVAWRDEVGKSATTSSRRITILPASSMWIASDSFRRCWYSIVDQQRIAQGSLMREQQAHDAEIGELARLRHAQTECAAARHARGFLEQRDHGREGNTLLGIGEQLAAQIDSVQQRLRIQAEMRRHFEVVRQYGRTDQRAHCIAH